MIRIAAFACLTLLFLTASTCERPIELDLDVPDSKLVVICQFTDGRPVPVQISKTQSVLTPSQLVLILNARVELYEGDQFLERLELEDNNGADLPYYTSRSFQPKAGINYTLKVSVPGFKTVFAENAIPARIPVRSLRISDYKAEPSVDDSSVQYDFFISAAFDDPEKEQNFYHLNFFQELITYQILEEDTVIVGKRLEKIRFSATQDNNYETANLDGGVLLEDTPFNGKTIAYSFPYQITVNTKKEILGKLFAELRTVSPEYFRYQRALTQQSSGSGTPFSEPVVVFNNIRNGAGIFAGYSSSIDSVAIGY